MSAKEIHYSQHARNEIARGVHAVLVETDASGVIQRRVEIDFDNPTPNLFVQFLPYLFFFGLIVAFYVWMAKRAQGQMSGIMSITGEPDGSPQKIGVAFDERMLSWAPGLRDTDGVWAPYWYDAVRASTGFEPRRPRDVELSPHDAAVAEACRPAYEELTARRIRTKNTKTVMDIKT